MEYQIEAKIEACWNDIKGKLDCILIVMGSVTSNNSS